jgi:hypothetical protein
MKAQVAQRCRTCKGLELVFDPGNCGNCASQDVEAVELPPKPALRRHQEAYRARAGLVGELLSCICTYPLDVNPDTASGCDPRCPRERMAKARIEKERELDERPPWER